MELNRIYLDSDFSNTIVPVGQRFLFLGYYDGIEGSEIVIRYKDSDGNFGNIASGSINEEPKEQYIEVDSLSNGFIVINTGSIPVFIKTSLGNFYPIEKDTLFQNNESFYIDATPYLAYDNATEFSGNWRIYLSNGAKGDSLTYNEVGVFADRSKYDDKPYKFSFLATDQGMIYIKLSDNNGDWSEGIEVKGRKGEDGQALEANYIDVTTPVDGFLVVSDETIPVSVEINNAVFPVLGMIKENNTFKIPIAPILASANIASYSGIWRVWRAGGKQGVDGEQGINGGTFPIALVDALPENPDPSTLYLIPMG